MLEPFNFANLLEFFPIFQGLCLMQKNACSQKIRCRPRVDLDVALLAPNVCFHQSIFAWRLHMIPKAKTQLDPSFQTAFLLPRR